MRSYESLSTTSKKSEDQCSGEQSSDKQILKSDHKKFESMDNQVKSYSRPKSDIKPQLNLI